MAFKPEKAHPGYADAGGSGRDRDGRVTPSGGPTAQRSTHRSQHRFELDRRERMKLDGVIKVDSFDDTEVIMETDLGMLHVKGDGLHIEELNLTAGTLFLSGFVSGLLYTSDRSAPARTKGFFKRLLK